jgi:DNA polymerase-3 subunit delta
MTTLKGREAAEFVKRRDPNVVVALLYGQDQGLIRENASLLGRQVVADLDDPWSAISMGDGDFAEIGHLADEAAALSFGGGERLIRIRTTGDVASKAVRFLLDEITAGRLKPNAFVVIEAGDLKKTNGLRKACEASRSAVAIACYPDDEHDVAEAIRQQITTAGMTIEDDALLILAARLGDDRGVTRSEIDKLILYKGPTDQGEGTDKVIRVDDAVACLADSATDVSFDVVDQTFSGRTDQLSRSLFKATGAGVSPLSLLRLAENRAIRLLSVSESVASGTPVATAMQKLQPPVFYPQRRAFQEQLRRWPATALRAAVDDLLRVDIDSKETGAPQAELVERVLLRLSVGAARRS